MSYEMKDILKTMIDNNERHWSADTMDMVRVEIHNVYAQAAKADEYEAKAKAWDRYKAHMESHIDGEINEEEFVSDLKSDYFESGEYDD